MGKKYGELWKTMAFLCENDDAPSFFSGYDIIFGHKTLLGLIL